MLGRVAWEARAARTIGAGASNLGTSANCTWAACMLDTALGTDLRSEQGARAIHKERQSGKAVTEVSNSRTEYIHYTVLENLKRPPFQY